MNGQPDAAPALRVRLLGRFTVLTASGCEVRMVSRHAQALFTLLVLDRRLRTREALAADLWPDSSLVATAPLRQALYQLRASLSAAGLEADLVLLADGDSLAIREGALASLDVTQFEACTDDPACASEEAIALYGGDLAEGLGHDCFVAERERLADRYEDALTLVAAQRLADGKLEGARDAAERVVARDPLREEAHAVLIAIHGRIGSRSQVVRRYRRLRDILARELGELPLPETDVV